MGRKNVNAQSRAMISRLDTCLFVMLSQKLFCRFNTYLNAKKKYNRTASKLWRRLETYQTRLKSKKVGLDLFEKSFNWTFPHQILFFMTWNKNLFKNTWLKQDTFRNAKIRFINENQNLDFENGTTNRGQSRILRHLQGVKISVENQLLHLM